MLPRLVMAALMLLASAGFAIAETVLSPPPKPEACVRTLDATRDRLAGLAARGAVTILTDIEGEAAEIWIARFNAIPPRTEFAGDAVLAIAVSWSPCRISVQPLVRRYHAGGSLFRRPLSCRRRLSLHVRVDQRQRRSSAQAIRLPKKARMTVASRHLGECLSSSQATWL